MDLVVVEGRRVAVSVDGLLVHDPVELVRRHAHVHRRRRRVEHLAAQLAGDPKI